MADSESAVERARKEGNYFFKQKQYDAAITAYKKGLDVVKENVLLFSNLAQVYLVTREYAQAEVMACKAIECDPTWYKSYNRAAISAENTGQLEKACSYLKRGIEVLTAADPSKTHETAVELDHFKQQLLRMEERMRLRSMYASQQPCGLIFDSDNEESDYDADSDTHSVSSLNSKYVGSGNITRSDSLGKMTFSSSGGVSDRSRSASVPPTPIVTAGSAKKKTEMPPPKSTSIAFSVKEKKKSKKKSGPIKLEDLERDPFISFLSTASLVPDDKVEREKFFQMKKKEVKTLLMEGSQALEAGIFMAAVEKFRSVYDNVLEFPHQDLGLKEMDVVVVKYLLCVSWVSLTIYEDIVQAIKMMQDMEITYCSKFPAIYYALGLAYCKLNRFKSAAVYVEKGLEFIRKNLRLCVYPWPGTVSKPIKETTREGFEYVLTELLKNCHTHHKPNAVCRYENCRKLSQHIEPSELIFYNDPDFNGFIVVICEEKCRIEYHVHCWKDFKDTSSIQKVTDKDMLGQNCPTEDCVNKKNQHSVIVRIEIMGENAAIKTSLDWPGTTDVSKDTKLNKRRHTNSESLSGKHKQRSGREKSKEKEHETLKEQRRQEKYRKSELIDQENNQKQEDPKENVKSTIKNKSDENQKIQNNQKEQCIDFPTLFDKLRKGGKQGVEIKTVYRSDNKGGASEEETDNKHSKMLRENEIGLSRGLLGISYESIYGSDDENIDTEDFDNEIDILMCLHDDDCISDCTEDVICDVLESLRSEQEIVDEERLTLSDPCKPFFGVGELKYWGRFLPESEIECTEDEVKEFICSYMYEYLRSADSQTIQDVDDKWIEDCDELKMDFSRVKHHQSQITELLLISPLFTALDDHFGLAESVPFLYDMLKEELTESYDFVFCKEDIPDIYNSQEELGCDVKEPTNDNEIKVTTVEASAEYSSPSPVVDTQSNILPTIYKPVKWSTNDGQTMPQSQSDHNTIVKKWTTNGEGSETLSETIETENLPLNDAKFSFSDKTVTALTELLAPSKEDRQTIWTGILKWTVIENKSRSSSCSILRSSKVKEATLNENLWPQEMTMQLVSHDFIETIGFDTLCQLSNIVTFELAIGEDSESLSQDLGSKFAGFIAINTSVGMTCMVVIFFQNTCTYVGLAPHQCVSILSGMLAEFCHQPSVQDSQESKMESGVQTDTADYEVKLSKFAEENERVKVECDEQKEQIATLSSTVESLQSQHRSLQLLLDAEKKMCAELTNKCFQHEGENVKLQEKLHNLERKCEELNSKLLKQEKKNQVLEESDTQHRTENEALKTTLTSTQKHWEEDKDQIKILTKKNELSEKLFNKKIEAVEETNRALRNELNSNEDKFKQHLITFTEEKIALTQERAQLQEKIALMEERRQELETSQDKLKAQENKRQETLYTHLKDVCNDAMDRMALVIRECCKNRIEELTHLASAVASNGNTALLNEVDNWLKIWQSCYDEAGQRLDTLKTVYPGILEKLKSGEMVNFPEFNVKLPSQPQNIVDVFVKMNKKMALLPTPVLVAHSNPSPFTGNSLYYPPYPNPQMYFPQQPGFAQIPQQHAPIPAYSGNNVALPETTTGNTLVQLQALAKKVSDSIASTTVETMAAVPLQQTAMSKTPAVTNTTDSVKAVPGQAKPVASAVPFRVVPVMPAATVAAAATTMSTAKVISVPVKTVPLQQTSAIAPVNSSSIKPPSLLDLPLPKKLVTQPGKVQQNPKPKSHHYQKLIADLKKKYANKSDEELALCISIVRERNNNKLTGLPLPTIITMVGKVLQEQTRKKDGGSMGLDKFGTTAWQLKSAETVQWSKPKDTSDEECTICIEPLGTQITTLCCNHSFHTSCIRTWLQNESVCPICRIYTRMVDEFPPLA